MATLTLPDSVSFLHDPVRKKYYDFPEENSSVSDLDWILRCAECAVEESYQKGSPRLIQMSGLVHFLRDQLKKEYPDCYDESGK